MKVKSNMEKYVIDASALLTFFLPDEKPTTQIDKIIEKFSSGKCELFAPELLKTEVGNALRSCVLRKRMPKKRALDLFEKFLLLEVNYEDVNLKKALSLSIKYNISLYDGIYAYLAKSRRVPLLTRDSKLNKLLNS